MDTERPDLGEPVIIRWWRPDWTGVMASVGYRQVLEHLEGKLAREALVPAIDRATKVFARRQRTWLRDRMGHGSHDLLEAVC